MATSSANNSVVKDNLTLDQNLPSELQNIIQAKHHCPSSILGVHSLGSNGWVYRALRPNAETVWLQYGDSQVTCKRLSNTSLFIYEHTDEQVSEIPTQLRCYEQVKGNTQEFFDSYLHKAQIPQQWLDQFGRENCTNAYQWLGAHRSQSNSISGIRFAVWAPNAERVSVVGDFNHWDGRINPMNCRGDSGIWELFVPRLEIGELYKYEIRNRRSGAVFTKVDPYGFYFEKPPRTANYVTAIDGYLWQDQDWQQNKQQSACYKHPVSVYEVHLGSWKRNADGEYLTYRELAEELVAYVSQMGFTHIELLPITEFPFDGSWGYQVLGYFAPTSRFGTFDDFKYFVDCCHQHNIGVILDWVPGHFPRDSHGLAAYDGTELYEHADPKRGSHEEWGTLIFDYGRNEVKNFLLSSANFWLSEFHIDGLRVDAVASMLYLDYGRKEGEWYPNIYGGNEHLEAIEFLKQLNIALHEQHPGTMIIAEESTSWAGVSRPTYTGGLGFTMKWNMGWMNDTLKYFAMDPVYRQYNHELLTFSQLYAYSENFLLPLSHDEVVHGKKSLLNKMPGDVWQQFAHLRLLFAYQFCHPGKKLLFMGDEFGQGLEWNHDQGLPWELLEYDYQRGTQLLITDLNHLYVNQAALHQQDFEATGFRWIDCHDHQQSCISFLRQFDQEFVIVVLNFTPIVRHHYRLGVPEPGVYAEILNTDSGYYGGSNLSNGTAIVSEPLPYMDFSQSISLTLPPLAGLMIKLKSE